MLFDMDVTFSLALLSWKHMQVLQRPIAKGDKFRVSDWTDETPTTLTCQMAFLAALVMESAEIMSVPYQQ